MRNVLLIVVLAAFSAVDSSAQKPLTVPGEVLFQLRAGADPKDVEHEFAERNGFLPAFMVEACISPPMRAWLGSFDPNEISLEEVIRQLRVIPGVSIAQANHIISTRETIPDDPFFGNQWHHKQNSDRDIDSELAWDITTGGQTPFGDDIVVCVIEPTGAKWDHPDLIENHWVNIHEIPNNGIDDDGNGFVDDYHGWNVVNESGTLSTSNHGTQVSSMIGAKGNNGMGISGVNWNVKIMQVQLGSITESAVVNAYTYPLVMRKLYNETGGQRGAYVVATNSSWGVDNGQPDNAPLWCAMYDSLGTYGVLSCGATANNNVNVDNVGDLPTGCPSDFLIAVTATNNMDVRTFAAFGPISVDLAAPGAGVYLAGNSSYGNVSGTSFATPCVAGAVALMYSAPCNSLASIAHINPPYAAQLVRDYILSGVDPVAGLANQTATGGRLNLRNSLDLILEDCDNNLCIPPIALTAATSDATQSVAIAWTALTETEDYILRYRVQGTIDWITVEELATTSVTLENLLLCAVYEFQVRANCSSGDSEWSNPQTFTSGGCCEAPSAALQTADGGTTLTVSWEAVVTAEAYHLELSGPDLFVSVDNVEGVSYTFTDVFPCSSYSVSIFANCPVNPVGEPIVISANTGGCASCEQLDYCAVSGGASNEWIAHVAIHDLVNSSASNGGYAFFDDLSTTLVAGETYPIACTPGYAGFNYTQYFRVWADWNANGTFETNEMIFDPGSPTTQQVSGNFTVPVWVTPGHIRVRVAMSYLGNFGGGALPVNCGTIQYGEVEDYCVIVQQSVGIQETSNDGFRIFPNPARESFVVIAPLDGSIRIHDLQGRLLKQASVRANAPFAMTDLASGVYVVSHSDPFGNVATSRVVVQ